MHEKMAPEALTAALLAEIEAISGLRPADIPLDAPLVEFGLDSLMLLQFVSRLKSRFGVEISLGMFFSEAVSVRRLMRDIAAGGPAQDGARPAASLAAAPTTPVVALPVELPPALLPSLAPLPVGAAQGMLGNLTAVFAQQTAIFAQQIDTLERALRGHPVAPAESATKVSPPPLPSPPPPSAEPRRAPAVHATPQRVAFLYPGQGAQAVGMGEALYTSEPLFRRHIDEAGEVLRPLLDASLTAVLYPSADRREAAERTLARPEVAMPALVAVEHALAALWASRGVHAGAALGYSFGEYTAACRAGVLDFADMLRVAHERGRLIARTAPGRMLSVAMRPDELAPLLKDQIAVAAVNATARTVVSGPPEAVLALAEELARRKVATVWLPVHHAFHSPLMGPILGEVEALFRGLTLRPPRERYVSSLTGTWIRPEEATSAAYWAAHLREPVRFAAGLDTLVADGFRVFVEVGPEQALGALTRTHLGKQVRVLPSLPRGAARDGARPVLLESLEVLRAEPAAAARKTRQLEFSLFYFAADEGAADEQKYRLLLDGAKRADQLGFAALWTPERHFHPFGGLYPNPAVTTAALATITERIGLRAGSVVLPLHHPVRVAEDWSVIDNLSRGRVGVAFASGWAVRDFVFAPDQHAQRRELMKQSLDQVRRLWRGEELRYPDGANTESAVRIYPRPVQPELPVWLTSSGTPDTFRLAGELGANLLTNLMGQRLADLAGKIAAYRKAWQDHGHGGRGHVTLMMHTFVGTDLEAVRRTVRGPMLNYLRGSLDVQQGFAATAGLDVSALSPRDIEQLIEHGLDRYIHTGGLFGTPESCRGLVEQVRRADVDEVACLIDFGIPATAVIDGLDSLAALMREANRDEPRAEG